LFLLTFEKSIVENVKFIVFSFFLFITLFSYSQSFRFVKKEDVRKKILGKTVSTALNFCHKKLNKFSDFIIVDTTFETVLIKQTVADSIQKIDFTKEQVRNKIESNIRLIERMRLNMAWYPLKKEIYEKEISLLDEDVLRLTSEIERLTTIRLGLLETPNMEEIDYYKVTFIGDSKNPRGESMFWYTTILYEPNGQIKIANFEP
jgi:hypothetical protein